MAHPNEELVRRAFDAFAKGDVDTLRELTDQDGVWHTPGRNQLSGDHRGVDVILGFFAKTAELTGGTFRADLHDVVANDDHAVAIYVARARGEPLRTGTCSCSTSATASWSRRGCCPTTSTRLTSSSPRRWSS